MELSTVNYEALMARSISLVGSVCVDTMVAEHTRNHAMTDNEVDALRTDLTEYVELNDVEI